MYVGTSIYHAASAEKEKGVFMNREEVSKLFRFFVAIRPKWKPEPNAADAWAIVLEPFAYEEVRRAAASCLRKHSYIPDPDEIATEITGRDISRDAPFRPDELTILDAYSRLQEKRIAAGLPPTPSQRGKAYLSISELMDRYDSLGLGLDSIGCEVKRVRDKGEEKEE